MKAAHAVQILWSHAGQGMPDAMLEHLASAEDAIDALRHIAYLLDGLGKLINVDGDNPVPAGNFQDGDSLPGLFSGLASSIAVQAELVAVASAAAELLRQRGASGC